VFIRHKQARPGGNWKYYIVESYRNAMGEPRQRIIRYLGTSGPPPLVLPKMRAVLNKGIKGIIGETDQQRRRAMIAEALGIPQPESGREA
jgi:hypothetical protein